MPDDVLPTGGPPGRTTALATSGFGAYGYTLQHSELIAIANALESLTYLAPSQGAIDSIDPKVLQGWGSPVGHGELVALTELHVLPGALSTAALAGGPKFVDAFSGQKLVVESFGGQLHVGEAAVVGPTQTIAWSEVGDYGAHLGQHLVHGVDAVLFPPRSVLETLKHRTAVAADKSQGYGVLIQLLETLVPGALDAGPVTVLAPNDAAFAADPDFDLHQALAPSGHLQTLELLARHGLAGTLSIGMGLQLGHVPTVGGKPVAFAEGGGGVTIGGAPVVRGNVACTDGAVHGLGATIA